MEEPQQPFPYLLPFQRCLTEEQALDWQLERFYNLCIFQKPTTSNPTTQNPTDATTNNAKMSAGLFSNS
jgi:hypothetical protein